MYTAYEEVEEEFFEWCILSSGLAVDRKESETIHHEFADVLHGKPGQTCVAEYLINTEARPIRQVLYRIPQASNEVIGEPTVFKTFFFAHTVSF